jgi:hypothetical protein
MVAVTVLLPSMLVAQYTPKWHVGDWWIVKEQMPSLTGRDWHWQTDRFDVLRIEKVDGRDCYVLQQGDTTSPGSGPRDLYYVRTGDCRIVRKVEYFQQAGKLMDPGIRNFPEGMFGLFPPGPHLPQFPLDAEPTRDSAFHLYSFVIGVTSLRQFSGLADSALLNSYLSYPNTSSRDRPVLSPGGKMYSVLCEEGAPRGPGGHDVPYTYDVQLWSTDYPWRLYEEWGQYDPPGSSARRSNSRSWLIAVGHKGK